MKKTLFILLVAFLPLHIVAQNSAVQRVKAALAELKNSAYEGKFSLQYYNELNDVTDKQSGEITLKGNKFRIMLGGNETKFNGKTQWIFVSDYNEVSITEPTVDELKDISPLAMIEYYVAKDKISEGKDGEINFYPTQPKESEYFRIELRLNKNNLLTRLVVHQKNGDKITLVWDSLNKIKVSDDYFVFDVKKYPNVEVNDLR
ncbi:MAG: outer membrane lipoprotein carrier protein LolA [Paludibacteraceae bacterium]|nr:outer membrane lipoprotein carrier protein LolA [Paludibacteraceae bacterium]